MRATEVYDVIFDWDILPGGQNRSGTHMWHDIRFTGVRPGSGKAIELALYRDIGAYGASGGMWGAADGTSPWDRNDTDGNGHFIEGLPPYLFASGAATTSKPEGSLVDSTANWTQNWATFRVRHLRLQKGSLITDNDAHTIHYLPYGSTDRGPLTIFQTGDQYQIHHLLTQLDQNGRGKGDLVRVVDGQPINTVTNTPFWTHEQVETCFNWNVTYAPTGAYLGFGSARHPEQVEGQEYVNLGNGFPPDTTPQRVLLFYTDQVNGVQYTLPYCYPHPLQGGSSGNPTLTLTPGVTSRPMATPTPPATPLVTPPAPSNLQASAVGCLSIELSWRDNSTNEYGFKVERSVDGSNFNQIDIVHHERDDVSRSSRNEWVEILSGTCLQRRRKFVLLEHCKREYDRVLRNSDSYANYAYTHRNPAGSDRLAIRRFGRKYPIDTRYTSARRRHDHVAGRHFQLDASR